MPLSVPTNLSALMTNPMTSKLIQEIKEDFKEKFMYPCSGCSDPQSEGTHQLESINHFNESATAKFLEESLNKIYELGKQEVIDEVLGLQERIPVMVEGGITMENIVKVENISYLKNKSDNQEL